MLCLAAPMALVGSGMLAHLGGGWYPGAGIALAAAIWVLAWWYEAPRDWLMGVSTLLMNVAAGVLMWGLHATRWPL